MALPWHCPISYKGRARGTTRGRDLPYFPSVQRIPSVVHSNWLKTWRRQPTEDSTTRGDPTARKVARRKSGIRTCLRLRIRGRPKKSFQDLPCTGKLCRRNCGRCRCRQGGVRRKRVQGHRQHLRAKSKALPARPRG